MILRWRSALEVLSSSRIGEHFRLVADPRLDRTKKHLLLDIIGIALCGVICGADGFVEIAAFGRAKEAWLATFLELPNGIPSHDTFGRVFAALDPGQFEQGLANWTAALAQRTGGQVIALDGKTLRRSHNRRNGQAALHLVSAWAGANRLVLTQRAVDTKSNEITALPLVLESLDVRGAVVTIDAMGCQTALAERIVNQGGDYVLARKENQPSLYEEVREAFAMAEADGFVGVAHDHVQTIEKGHGRVEGRCVTTIMEPSWLAHLDPDHRGKDLRCIVRIQSRRETADGTSEEQRYFSSSLSGDAQAAGASVRDHWGIENGAHWVLDMAFREDESRVRSGNAARNLAVLRRLALNLLRQDVDAKMGVKARRLRAGWDEAYLLRILRS